MKRVGDSFEIAGLVDMGEFSNTVHEIQEGKSTYFHARESELRLELMFPMISIILYDDVNVCF